MNTWTVISVVTHDGGMYDTRSGSPIAAIPGRADVAGFNVHAATVTATDADTAMEKVRAAFRIAGHITPNCDLDRPIGADRWTVIGTATNGVCATHSTVAVVAGEHTVSGRYELSPLSHRWEMVVDAPDAAAADLTAYRQMSSTYANSWN